MVSVHRGEVWYANLDPTTGREQAGDRPCLVISSDSYHQSTRALVIVCPLTTTRTGAPIHVHVDPADGGVTSPSVVLCDQIRAISPLRLRRSLGTVSARVIEEVEDRVRILLEL